MREAGRSCDLAWRDEHPRAHLGPVPHLHRKRRRHANAAMRRRITRQNARMHGDTGPGDALHVGHRRATVDVRMMEFVLLDDAENAHRRRMAGHTGGNWCCGKEAVGVVDLDLLPADRHRDDEWSLRIGAALLRRDRLLFRRAPPYLLPARRLDWLELLVISAGLRTLPVIQRSIGPGSRADGSRGGQGSDAQELSGCNG